MSEISESVDPIHCFQSNSPLLKYLDEVLKGGITQTLDVPH